MRRISNRPAALFSGDGHAITSIVSEAAITTDFLEKSFPPAYSGWRAFVQAFAASTVPALCGVSLQVKQGEAVALAMSEVRSSPAFALSLLA